MIVMIPINAVVAKKLRKYQQEQMRQKDKRVVLMDEVLSGIKIIKLYAWERIMKGKVEMHREKEVNELIKAAYLSSITTFLWTSAPFLVALASFTTYVLSDSNNVLDASTAFVSLTLFNLLRIPLNILPMIIILIIQVQVSLKRLNNFMNADELDDDAVTHEPDVKDTVVIENASFTWDRNEEPILKDINLRIKEGSLVAVVGQVGCGKSSLISAMLGEMHKLSGTNNTKGAVAYVPQQAWMKNATLRENILFGKSHKKGLYNRVLAACSLLPDLQVLPVGDQTEIGEKGINLSGGQKQRISVARSVYSNGDLYFLDDPLSAVDSHVGKHMFDNVIGPSGLLKNKTVVLVTHGIGYLKKMDEIIVMKNGTISEQGSYDELLYAQGEFSDFLVQYLADKENSEKEEDVSDLEDLRRSLEDAMGKANLQRRISKQQSLNSLSLSDLVNSESRRRNIKSSTALSEKTDRTNKLTKDEMSEKKDKLVQEEKAETGGVRWSVYFDYFKAIGFFVGFFSIWFFIAYQGFGLGSNIWLSKWSTDPLATSDIGVRNKYLSVYGIFGLLQATFVMFGTGFLQVGTLKASSRLHNTMLKSIMHSTMAFFDTTPLGRILNRFSKDVDTLDASIPMNLRQLMEQLFAVLGTMVAICYTNPIFIAIVIPVIFL